MSIYRIAQALGLGAVLFGAQTAQAAPPNPEKAHAYEVDLWVHTCDVSDAGTDSNVSVRMHALDGTQFFLDQPGDDRERDDWNYYQVLVDDVSKLEDIRRIQFNIAGDGDAWCFDEIVLKVNNDTVFAWSEGPTWIDDYSHTDRPSYFKIFSDELRDHAYWPSAGAASPGICRAPSTLPSSQMYDLFTGVVGDRIATGEGFPDNVKRVVWRGQGASLTRRDSNTWRFDIDLRADMNNSIEADIDATYDIDVSCGGGSLTMTSRLRSSDVDLHIPWYVTVLTGGIANLVALVAENIIDNKLDKALDQLNENFDYPTPICPDIEIDSGASLDLDWPSAVRTAPVMCF